MVIQTEESSRLVGAFIIITLDTMLIIAFISLFFVDKLVHGTLYDYGLVFSVNWAEPYWVWMRTSMALIGVVILVLSFLEFVYPLLRKKS